MTEQDFVMIPRGAATQLLNALTGPDYLVRELQATAQPVELFQYNPINVLGAALNETSHPDDRAVYRFAMAMREKLAAAREKGRHGWEDKTLCSDEDLADMLVDHLSKGNTGNYEDIANFAMMLHQRGAESDLLAKVFSASQNDASAAAIGYVLEHSLESPMEFLRCWNEGNFDALRKEWDNVPEEVFIGADPLHPQTKLRGFDYESLTQKAECWDSVVGQLDTLTPGWRKTEGQSTLLDDATKALNKLNAEAFLGKTFNMIGYFVQPYSDRPEVVERVDDSCMDDPDVFPLFKLTEGSGLQLVSFQNRVKPWLLNCFGVEIALDKTERNHRFLEESLELVQSLGCTKEEAVKLVEYVYGRPAGEPAQEVGGTMVTLAALCLAHELNMHKAGVAELTRISLPSNMERIRAKQESKPQMSPLPGVYPERDLYEGEDDHS